MNKTKLGFVGVGQMGQCAHLRNFAVIPECEPAAIAEIVPGLGEKVAARYGVPRVYASHEEMLANEDLDGIVAIQPFTRHGLLLPDLLKAGKPLLIEKPLAVSVESGETLVRTIEASGTWVMVGYHKRSDPAVLWAREKIERFRKSGELGPLRYVRITVPPGNWTADGTIDRITVDADPPQLETDPPPAGMDEETYKAHLFFVNFYIHQVNLLRYLMGDSYRVTFADRAGRLFVAETGSGITGAIEMGPYTTTRAWDEKILVGFEKGYLEISLPAPLARNRPGRVVYYRDPTKDATPMKEEPTLPWVDAMRNQAQNFVDAVRGTARPRCEAAEALADLVIARDYLRLFRGGR